MDETTTKEVIDEVSNALQTAVLVAGRLVSQATATAADATALERALRRATQSLQRLQPR